MTLAAGTRLGPYEIAAPLGAGGMGEVYKARDTRLSREVAIKVLPAEVAKDRDRVSRFEQEARAASALNHPNIVTVHDIGRSDDTVYIAMELVDGQTLGRMAAAGPVPVRRLLGIAAQVAEGLAKAHAAGIVHRDLKPENVMVSTDGFVKILDFGLAKLVSETSDSQSGLPTMGPPQTHPGTVLGTVGYMSPEQAAGMPLDFRTDQFSFGSILYEMATGKRAFQRATTVDTLAAILHEEPEPISRVTPGAPAPLRWIVDRCLEKDPRNRYASTLDLARELGSVRDHVSELSGGASALSAETRFRSRGRMLAAGLGAAALLIGLTGGWILRGRGRPAVSRPAAALSMALAPSEELVTAGFRTIAISRDGSRIAYVGGAKSALFLRSLDSLDAKRLPGTEGALEPFFSPDGNWVGFVAGGKLKKVSIAGGQPQALCDVTSPRGASWGMDGAIYFSPAADTGIWRVSENGGEPKAVTTPDRAGGEGTHRWPQVLPGGRAAVFTVHKLTGEYDRARIEAVILETGERRLLLEGGTDPSFLENGHLLFYRGAALHAVAFDGERLEVTGTAVPVVDGVAGYPAAGLSHAVASPSGVLVYLPIDPLALQRDLVWMDRKGSARALTDVRRTFAEPRLSRDGRRLAVTVVESGVEIWFYDLARSSWEQFTTGANSFGPVWSPDGRRIAFSSNRAGLVNTFVAAADRSAPPKQVTDEDSWPTVQEWSPDGLTLLLVQSPGGRGADLAAVDAEGGKLRPLLELPERQQGVRISPDGAWMAYESNESGRDEIYVARFPAPAGRVQVSTDGGTAPAWSPDGREVFFKSGNRLMTASVRLGADPSAGVPRVLFETDFLSFDPAPDGDSFVVLRRAHPNLPRKPLAVLLGFSDDVARRVSAKT